MGQAIASRIADWSDLELVGIWRRDEDLDSLVADADVVIDFSLPEGTASVLDALVRHKKPLVCGVTGLAGDGLKALYAAAEEIPLVFDRNMSQGITVIGQVLSNIGNRIGPEFKARIEETHHVHKKDKPSGTAIKLKRSVMAARQTEDFSDVPIRSEREGEVIGDHSVIFESPMETITISHSAKSREIFAEGAIKAARWVRRRRPPRLYTMWDVLFGEE